MTIREHPLAWRWTDAKHAILPEATLAQMQALEEVEAKQLNQKSLDFLAGERLSPEKFPTIACHSADVLLEVGRSWLRDQQSDLTAQVFISWQEDLAIRTTWDIFTAHWDAFCYPSSDDVAIWPDSEQWIVFYHHYEEFEFGSKRLSR